MKIKEKRMRSYIGRANILMQNKKEKEAAKAVSDGMQYYSNNVIKALSPYAAADGTKWIYFIRMKDQRKSIRKQKSIWLDCSEKRERWKWHEFGSETDAGTN